MISSVLLPESFSINLGLATGDNRNYQKDFIKTSQDVVLGLRADDGTYTSMHLKWNDIAVTIETATDGEDEVILVTPDSFTNHLLVVEAGVLYGKDGVVGKKGNQLTGDFPSRRITVSGTGEPEDNAYLPVVSPHLSFVLDKEIGVYTGHCRTQGLRGEVA